MKHFSPILSRILVGSFSVLLFACSQAGQKSPVFGGQGARVDDKERPLPAEGETAGSGACSAVAKAGEATLIDDFEDGDSQAFKAFQREGWWYTVTDDTAGAKISPRGSFAPERLPEGEARKDNLFAAHFTAEGQRDWGAQMSTSLHWVNDQLRCPFNASAFGGFKFRAKGPGTVTVSIGIPETVAAEHGGSCTKDCWDSHKHVVRLTEQWDEYVVRFDRLQQSGWGAEARFDSSRVIAVNFVVLPANVPIDFWVDDLEFVPADTAATDPGEPPAASR